MKLYYIATKEWITPEELQEKLNGGFKFKCNECHKEISDHLKTLAEGIFCEDCFNKIMGEITN